MGRAQIEALEVVGGVFFVAFGLVQTKVLESEILGFDLLMPLFEISGGGDTATITPAMIASLAILFGTLYNNDIEFNTWAALDFWLFLVTIWLILSPPFVPIIEGLIASGGWGGMVAVAIQSLGYGFLSWVD
jgi:hypothetical protein